MLYSVTVKGCHTLKHQYAKVNHGSGLSKSLSCWIERLSDRIIQTSFVNQFIEQVRIKKNITSLYWSHLQRACVGTLHVNRPYIITKDIHPSSVRGRLRDPDPRCQYAVDFIMQPKISVTSNNPSRKGTTVSSNSTCTENSWNYPWIYEKNILQMSKGEIMADYQHARSIHSHAGKIKNQWLHIHWQIAEFKHHAARDSTPPIHSAPS